ncbi:MAG: hypothetical protein AAF611_18960 [Bacteroidota bacterium]
MKQTIDKQQALKYTNNWKALMDTNDFNAINTYLNSGLSFRITRSEYEMMKANRPDTVRYYFGLTDEGTFKILIIDDVADTPMLKEQVKHQYILEKELGDDITLPRHQDSSERSNFDNELLKMLSVNHPSTQAQTLTVEKEVRKSQKHTVATEIEFNEGLDRMFMWSKHSLDWFRMKFEFLESRKEKGMYIFPLMANPFQDLEAIFESDPNTQFAYHFFGLKLKTEKKFEEAFQIIINMKKRNKDFIKFYTIDLMVTDFTIKENNTHPSMFDVSCICEHIKYEYERNQLSLLPK